MDVELDLEAECKKNWSERAKKLTMSAALLIADIDEQRSPEETALWNALDQQKLALPKSVV